MEARNMAEEKKENGFTSFFKKVGKDISNAAKESKLESTYNSEHDSLSIYVDGILGCLSKHGKIIDETHAEIYGELKKDEVPFSSILVFEPSDKKVAPEMYYITATSHTDDDMTTIKIKEKDGDKEVENEYKRPITILTLDKNIKEVNVIKVHNKYILKKEQN